MEGTRLSDQQAVDPMMARALELNAAYQSKEPVAPVEAAKEGGPAVKVEDKGVPRGEGGKFEKKPETIAKEESAKNERMTQAFRRAQVPDKVLGSLTPEARLSWGEELLAKQADQDRKSQELGKKKTSESRVVEPASAGQPQKAQDNLTLIDATALAERLALDEDERRGIEGWAKEVVKPYEAQLTAAEEAAEKATAERYDIGRELGIALNSTLYPEAATYRDQIEAKYDEYAESGAYDHYDPKEGVRLCARDAIEFVCKPQIDARKKSQAEAESRAKSLGQPSVSSRQGDGALSKTDPMMDFALKRVAGVPLEEARRQVWG